MGLGEKTQVAEECIQQDSMFILSSDLYLINHREQESSLPQYKKNIIEEKCTEFETERGDSNIK